MNNKLDILLHSGIKTLFVFDVDGTVYEAYFDKERLISKSESVLEFYLSGKMLYNDIAIIPTTRNIIKEIQKQGHDIKFLTRINSSIDYEGKKKRLDSDFEDAQVMGVFSEQDKVDVINHYSKEYYRVVYIDDNLETAIQVKTNTDDNVHALHLSTLLVD